MTGYSLHTATIGLNSSMRNTTVLALVFYITVFSLRSAQAEIRAKDVAVVINSASESSQKLAEAYVALRGIPESNLIELDNVPNTESTTVDVFRERLLKPVLSRLDERKLRDQIDCIVWSSDFPTAISLKSDIGSTKTQRVLTPHGSINGLTFLYEGVLKKDVKQYLSLVSNGYYRRPFSWPVPKPLPPSMAREVVGTLQKAAKDDSWEQASALLEKVLVESPGNTQLHLALARCFAKQGDNDSAVDHLRSLEEASVSASRSLRRDPALKSILSRDDVKTILDRMDENDIQLQPTTEFHSTDRWNTATGERTGDPNGTRYLLSTVLAVTRGRGTTVEEAIANLRRSVKADRTHPDGTFYFPVNGNVRSTCRDNDFTAAVLKLRSMGHKAEVVSGVLPQMKDDVAGAMIGTASFEWKKSGSTIMPGAICEHLTSFGGIMRSGAGQTPLTEFLRNGAAGASGTVAEPYAIAHKFPSPFIHVHYARGSCLAEAFYQSVWGPYQLLIVGDPLCRPWGPSEKGTQIPQVSSD